MTGGAKGACRRSLCGASRLKTKPVHCPLLADSAVFNRPHVCSHGSQGNGTCTIYRGITHRLLGADTRYARTHLMECSDGF
ncbi:hypothetical protein TNIN_232471 [Trichonephila inaurata madagascariensis]|uniref:Uncharacterized protein n=1 Tax=Trichonephila inaurata madagascariensis TaxID=2747483 RepID=A0A8X7CHJ6_9ARAC|nr:hypothetical protein TNIN_232471 [Trichonephila inaurata madagascariensis]